jgi:hypothetical protein
MYVFFSQVEDGLRYVHLCDFNPGALSGDSLLSGFNTALPNSPYGYGGGEVNAYGSDKVDPEFSSFETKRQLFGKASKSLGATLLIICSVFIAGYSLKRCDYLLAVGLLGGLIPFLLGFFLLLSVFDLPS